MENEDLEIENAVLGAIILENYAYDLVSADLKAYCFGSNKNQMIYQSITELKQSESPIDYMTIGQHLKNKGLLESVTMAHIINLTNRIASPANIEHHSRIIIEKYLLRKIKEICSFGLIKINDRGIDVFDVYEDLKEKFDNAIQEVSGNKSFDTIDSMADEFLRNIELKKSKVIPPSLSTGLHQMDKYGGFNDTDLIYIGARPGMGKTAFIILTIRHIAIALNKSVGVFSLEMPSSQLLRRIASAECQINGEDLRNGNVSDAQINQLHKRVNELKASKIYIDDKTYNIDLIVNKARNMKRNHGINILIIDYLGFIKAKGYERDKNGEITEISRKLKSLAKELKIPVICLSQLNRDIEKRPLANRFPELSDLRDSGSIEQDADQVIFLFRPDYYKVDSFFVKDQEIDTRGKCFLSYAKNRHGVVDTMLVGFKAEYTEFHNLPGQYPETEVVSDKVANQPNNNFLNETNTGEDLPF